MNKRYFRYLLGEFLQVFAFCLIACSALWLIIDLFGSLDDFTEGKTKISLIVEFYVVQFPRMLLLVIPMALLFSTLFTLLTFTKHNELIALQAAGLSWRKIYNPFIMVGVVVFFVMAFLSMGPANHSTERRRDIQEQIRSKTPIIKTFKKGVPYYDSGRKQVWYVSSLDVQKGSAEGVEIAILNAEGKDDSKFIAEKAQWNGNFWILKEARVMKFNAQGSLQSDVAAPIIQDGRFSTPPKQMALLQAKPEELNFFQLIQYLREGGERSSRSLAPYWTQLFQQIAHAFFPLVLLLFAFCSCGHEVRRNPAAGVFNAIFILMAYYFVMHFFLAMGSSGRLPASISAFITPILFAAIGFKILTDKTRAYARVKAVEST